VAKYTPNFNLIKPDPDDFYNIQDFNDNMDKLDANAVKKDLGIAELISGTLEDRPDPGIAGRYYFAQDKGEIWFDTGTEWVLAAASREAFIAHLAETMPHRFSDGTKTYRWGLAVIDGVVNMVYEEVS